MKYFYIYTNWVRQCKTQVKARLLLTLLGYQIASAIFKSC